MRKVLLSAIIAVVILTSCDKDDTMIPNGYVETTLPSDVTQLYESQGPADSDTVWIYIQGGPVVERIFDLNEKDEETEEDVYPFYTDDLVIYPFQTQQINTTIAKAPNFTFEHAKVESSRNADIVKMITDHFEDQDKVVYIIGHSYGAFITHEILAKHGPIGRKIVSLNGRLDMPTSVWEGFSRGEIWLFDKDGQNPFLVTKNENEVEGRNLAMMAAGLGFNRYTSELEGVDLSDALFFTGGKDEAVGVFNQTEVDFVKKNAEVGQLVPNFDHSDIFIPEAQQELYGLIVNEE